MLPKQIVELEYFKHLVYNGAKIRYGNIAENIEKRLNDELQVINDKRWAEYFLLMRDMVDTICTKGAIVAETGSTQGSLVAYCLRITDIDPIAYHLLFERFANTGSMSISFSFCVDTEGKNEAVRFLNERGIIEKEEHRGRLPDENLTSVFGEPEFDIFLSDLKSLSIIRKVIEIYHTDAQIDIDIEHIPTDDPLVYQKFANGEASGLWGFESEKMRELCLRLFKLSGIEDLAAIYAASFQRIEQIANLIAGKYGCEKIKYEIPELEKHLKNTYGLTIYQEQVMSISRDLAGFTPNQSNELRKDLNKKLVEKLNDFREMFLEGCSANGYDKKKVVEIWNRWICHGRYQLLYFDKSHAISMALIEYRMAWLKTYHPLYGVLS